MIKRVFAVMLLIALSPLAQAQAQTQEAQQGRRITIASYNIENAFDVFDDPYTSDEGAEVKQRWQLEAIAAAVREMNADVVAFCELESEGLLRAMVSEMLPDMGYSYISVIPTNSGRGINLGVISKLPIRSVTSHRWQTLTLPGYDETWRFARDLMHTQVALDASGGGEDGQVLHLFSVHLKSRRSGDGDPNSVKWRTAEATRVRQIMTDLIAADPDALAVIVGDFNTYPQNPEMQLLLSKDPTDEHPELTDVHSHLTTEQRITFPSEKYPNTIFDYILTSPALAEHYVEGSAAVLTDPEKTKGSDHRPVSAAFELAP